MNELHAMLEKAKNNCEFEAKLKALSENGAKPEEIIAFAADHGFAITSEDLESCKGDCAKCGELTEDDLDAVAGGGPTQNRYDPNVCPTVGRTRYECVGFLQIVKCDHYQMNCVGMSSELGHYIYRHICNMGAFNYVGKPDGSHVADKFQDW